MNNPQSIEPGKSYSPQDVQNIILKCWGQAAIDRILHEDYLMRSYFWVGLVEGNDKALEMVKEEMRQYDRSQSKPILATLPTPAIPTTQPDKKTH